MRVWMAAMPFMRLREVAAAAAVCRCAGAAAAATHAAPPPPCGHLRPRRGRLGPPSPHVEEREVGPPAELAPFQQCVLRQMLQCVHPCVSLRTGEPAAELAAAERQRQQLPAEPHPEEDPTAAMIAGSFALRQLERALLGRAAPDWTPGDVDIFVIATTQDRAVRWMRTVCERIQRRLGLPWLATRTRSLPYCEGDGGFVILGDVAAPPPVGRGLPKLSFIWRAMPGELRSLVRTAEQSRQNQQLLRNWRTRYPPYRFDLSVCRVALWVGWRGEWMLEFPAYVAADVRARCFTMHWPVRAGRRHKYESRGYRQQLVRFQCEDCQQPYGPLYRGGCRRTPPFRAEWQPAHQDSELCGFLGVLCESCLRSAGGREWTCSFCNDR
jgi:hypothetical protein